MHITTSNQAVCHLGYGNYTCNWGAHIAGLYETEAERDEIIFGFLGEGMKQGDMQLYCPSERTSEDFQHKFCSHHGVSPFLLKKPDLFQISSARDFYYPDGIFSPWAMDDGFANFYKESQKNGPRNVRATAEMTWALDAIPGVNGLMAYESRLNYFVKEKPWISICLYDVTKFSGAIIMNVLKTHPFTISAGIITENPFYLDPDSWLKVYAPDFLIKSQ